MHFRPCLLPSGGQKWQFWQEQVNFFALMQYTYATSAYHEARFLVHFCLAIRANFERGDFDKLTVQRKCFLKVIFVLFSNWLLSYSRSIIKASLNAFVFIREILFIFYLFGIVTIQKPDFASIKRCKNCVFTSTVESTILLTGDFLCRFL